MSNHQTHPGFSALILGLLGSISLFPFAASATAGQGVANPAGIIGQVTDGTGAVLPGVTVTATSPALQVPSVVTVTDEQGDYRLAEGSPCQGKGAPR